MIVILDNEISYELLNYGDQAVFDDVEAGSHIVQAFRYGDNVLGEEIGRIEIFVAHRKDYFWTVRDCIP